MMQDTSPCYRINYLPKKYKQVFSRKTEITRDENQQVMKKNEIANTKTFGF